MSFTYAFADERISEGVVKGVVFTEFLDFVEGVAGDETLDDMIEMADVPSGGAYTAVGKYPHTEMLALVGALSKLLETPAPQLVRAFGQHLFGRFVEAYPRFFDERTDALTFLETVEDHIHVEVLKLYPDAELPSLEAVRTGPDAMRLTYGSCRPFGELCIGLVEGCAAHFDERLDIAVTPIEGGMELHIRRAGAQAA